MLKQFKTKLGTYFMKKNYKILNKWQPENS